MIVYVATNTINGKQYVGQTTVHFENRQKQHLYHASHESTSYFHRALRKYGANNFEWEIIGQCNNIDELNEKEKYYIDKLGSFVDKNPGGYNCSTGGSNFLLSEETRAKISASSTGKKLSEETKAKLSVIRTGKKHSEETKAKISAFRTGKKHSEETKAKLSAINTGKLHPMYGKTFSEETRAKLRKAHLGKKHIKVTCPHCEKIGSKAVMTRWHFDNCKFKG